MTEQQYQNRISELEKEVATLQGGKTSITQIGVHIPRDTGGTLVKEKAVKIYALTSDLQTAAIAPPPQDDKKAYTDIAGIFCQKQKAFVESVKAAERENARRPRTIPPDAETPEDLTDVEIDEAERRALDKIRNVLRGAGLKD